MRSSLLRTSSSALASCAVVLAAVTGCADTSGPGASPTASAEPTAQAEASEQWSYQEGPTGPGHWGELEKEYAACSTGKAQSPVDVPVSAVVSTDPLELDYAASDFEVHDTGHTVEFRALSPQAITVEGTRYAFKQMHYHVPSEHTLDGAGYDAEFHLVHQADDGRLAVIGVFATEGATNPAWSPVTGAVATATDGDSSEMTDLALTSLLPASLDHYAYDGSLTTPPCTETVRWLLPRTPVELDTSQLSDLRSAYADNNRPTQSLNDRKVIQSVR